MHSPKSSHEFQVPLLSGALGQITPSHVAVPQTHVMKNERACECPLDCLRSATAWHARLTIDLGNRVLWTLYTWRRCILHFVQCIAVIVLQSSCPGQVWWIHDPATSDNRIAMVLCHWTSLGTHPSIWMVKTMVDPF